MARVDLNPVEEARACAMLVDDLGLTKEEVGRRVGKSRVAVSNLIRLLELPDEVLDLIAAGTLSEGHGRAILTAKDHDRRKDLAREARDGGWSVRETEARARGDEEATRGPRREPVAIHPDLADALAAAEDALTAAIGHDVTVKARGDGARAELVFDAPGDAIALAERLLRGDGRGLAGAA
jgi:ParB family chromosome partitioning protein